MVFKATVFLFLCFSFISFSNTYYVDATSGNDLNTGDSPSSAWKTISKINSFTFFPGDSILFKRGDEWKETLIIKQSGTEAEKIYYGAYGSGSLPIINSELIRSNSIYLSSKSFITIKHLKLINASGNGGIRVRYAREVLVDSCEFLITSHGGVFIENSTQSIVSNNKMRTPEGALSAQTDGIYSQRNSNNIYDGNNIIISNEHTSPHCDGIQTYLDTSIIICNNYIEQRNSKTYNSQGIYSTTSSGEHIYFNNVVYLPNSDNALIGFRNLATGTGTVKISNNTLVTGRGYSLLHITDTPDPQIKNNIFQTNNPIYGIRLENWAGNPANINYNLYNLPNTTKPVYLNGSSITWNQIQALGMEANGVVGNPEFKDSINRDFSISLSSPAIDMAEDLGAPFNKDIIGTSRPQLNGVDAGAYEAVNLPGYVTINVKVFLQGPFNNGNMNTHLNSLNLLPSLQPYSSSPWNYNGNETLQSSSSNLVDWILIEIRTGTSPLTVIGRKAGLLNSDGTITAEDGNSVITFGGVNQGNYYVVIYHRNHLAVMTSAPIALTTNSNLYDFTSESNKAYGVNPMANLTGGFYGMIAGDCNSDNKVKFTGAGNDRSEILSKVTLIDITNIVHGYYSTDLNLDGVTRFTGSANDRSIILFTTGLDDITKIVSSQVP